MRTRWMIVLLAVGIVVGMGTTWVYSGTAGQEKGEKKEAPKEAPPLPPRPMAELKVLDMLVGKWNDEISAKPCTEMPEGFQGKGTFTSEWTLDGWFVLTKYTSTSDMGPYESIGLMTYDPVKKAYRSWWFDSMGECADETGKWDPATKTFSFTGTKPELQQTSSSKTKQIDNDTYEWTSVRKDKDGKVLLEISGKSTRQK